MTLAMPDSIYVANLPAGYPAYLGYADGNWPTAAELAAKFPAAYLVILTVTGETDPTHAHGISSLGIDAEPGDPTAAHAVSWVMEALAEAPGSRPIVYADLATPGYSMVEVINGLNAVKVPRDRYRILTAHWTDHPHICGPHTCGDLPVDADGTQWTARAPGLNHSQIDMSQLTDSFFTGTIAPEDIVIVPGMPGMWLAPPVVVRESNGRLVALGQGTSGAAYTLVLEPGAPAWVGPTRV